MSSHIKMRTFVLGLATLLAWLFWAEWWPWKLNAVPSIVRNAILVPTNGDIDSFVCMRNFFMPTTIVLVCTLIFLLYICKERLFALFSVTFISLILCWCVIVTFAPQFSPYNVIFEFSITKFADGFSLADYSKVRAGMTKEEVKNLVGVGGVWDPVFHNADNTPNQFENDIWNYSTAYHGENYWRAYIRFDNGVVVERNLYFWYD